MARHAAPASPGPRLVATDSAKAIDVLAVKRKKHWGQRELHISETSPLVVGHGPIGSYRTNHELSPRTRPASVGAERSPRPESVRLGTGLGLQAADELAHAVIENFEAAARRYADLLDEAEARLQADRQPIIECIGSNYVFRTEPESGVVKIITRGDGSVRELPKRKPVIRCRKGDKAEAGVARYTP